MIGWYIHHVGRGHLQRAQAVSRMLSRPVVGLSSLPRPDAWRGPWMHLERDDVTTRQPTASGWLHWAPLHDAGLRQRMAAVSSWIEHDEPALLVSDVSAEVTLLARLHGVPVVSVVLPGDRSDPAHVLAYRVSDALVAAWPGAARDVTQVPDDIRRRIRYVGGLSRSDVADDRRRPDRLPRRVTVLMGAGGTSISRTQLTSARGETPGWRWTVLAVPPIGSWVDDPARVLRESDVVITHAGQNAIAEVAAARRPAIVIPQRRPHAEQEATAHALTSDRWPATVLWSWPGEGWDLLLDEASTRDGGAWEAWCDGDAACRFADILERMADQPTGPKTSP
jgi:hypothetical protein